MWCMNYNVAYRTRQLLSRPVRHEHSCNITKVFVFVRISIPIRIFVLTRHIDNTFKNRR